MSTSNTKKMLAPTKRNPNRVPTHEIMGPFTAENSSENKYFLHRSTFPNSTSMEKLPSLRFRLAIAD
jgi:hypothetical protein